MVQAFNAMTNSTRIVGFPLHLTEFAIFCSISGVTNMFWFGRAADVLSEEDRTSVPI